MTQPCCPPTQTPAISKQADACSQRVVLVQDASCTCEHLLSSELLHAAVPASEPAAAAAAAIKHHNHKHHRSKSGGSSRGGAHHHKHQQQDASAAVTVAARCHSCSSGTSPANSSSGSIASAASGGQGAAAVGDGRAKSFTAGCKAAHHQHAWLGHHSGCGQQARSSSGSRSASPNSGSGRPGHAKHQQLLARHVAADINFCARAWSPVKQAVLLAESVDVEDIAKGFALHWYYNGRRQLHVYDGSKATEAPVQLLKHVPQTPGLHLWLVRPPCSRQWVPVHLAAAANLQQSIASYLHADGSCGPVGSKQKVLLDLQCRGFAVAVRYRPLKPGAGSVQADLLAKLQHFDFALNDVDNAGCRPVELPNGRPVATYPLVAVPMMQALYESLFGPRKLL